MKIWLDIAPLSWMVWPLWGSHPHTFPDPTVTHYVGLGPVRFCWEREVHAA